jgi:hypothetical protein
MAALEFSGPPSFFPSGHLELACARESPNRTAMPGDRPHGDLGAVRRSANRLAPHSAPHSVFKEPSAPLKGTLRLLVRYRVILEEVSHRIHSLTLTGTIEQNQLYAQYRRLSRGFFRNLKARRRAGRKGPGTSVEGRTPPSYEASRSDANRLAPRPARDHRRGGRGPAATPSAPRARQRLRQPRRICPASSSASRKGATREAPASASPSPASWCWPTAAPSASRARRARGPW